MTTFHVYSRGHVVMTTHDKDRAEKFAACLRGGSVVKVERELTAGELMAAERFGVAA